jgi:hypothetical protein
MSVGLQIYTAIHVLISLAAIGSGLIVTAGLLSGKRLNGWTSFFLATTLATSITGFFFPFHGFKPSYVVAALSVLVLIVAYYARYGRQMAGNWRWIFIVTAMLAFYLNFFVLIIQSFAKIPALKQLAPTQTEPPFAISQLICLILFILLTVLAVFRFHPGAAPDRTAELNPMPRPE